MAEAKKERIKLVTPVCRVSYPSVFQAKKVNPDDKNATAKFSLVMLFRTEKTEASRKLGEKVVDIEPLKAAVRKVLFDKFGEGWRTELTKKKADGSPLIRLPFRSGTEEAKKDSK